MSKPDLKAVALALQDTASDRTASVIAERGARYGLFATHAGITQNLKQVLYAQSGYARLDADMREALDMIMHKTGRIINGDPHYGDSWRDIAGYAALVADRLETD